MEKHFDLLSVYNTLNKNAVDSPYHIRNMPAFANKKQKKQGSVWLIGTLFGIREWIPQL